LIDAILSNGEGAPASVDRADEDKPAAADRGRERPGRPRRRGGRSARSRRIADEEEDGEEPGEAGIEPAAQEASGRGRGAAVEGVVEVLPNGSGFLRVSPPEPSDDDVYISAAQVKRCELVSGDRVSGPRRAPRRSERFASMIKIDTINGQPADEVADSARFDDLPAGFATERFRLGSEDPTLKAIEWLTPFGKG